MPDLDFPIAMLLDLGYEVPGWGPPLTWQGFEYKHVLLYSEAGFEDWGD